MFRTLSRGGPGRILVILLTLLSTSLVLHSILSVADVATTQPNAQSMTHLNTTVLETDIAKATAPQEKEIRLADGVKYYTRDRYDAQPSVLWLVMTKDAGSWGKRNAEHSGRNFSSFLTLLATTQLDLSTVSLGLLTSCAEEYALYKAATTVLDLARVTVILHPGYITSPEDIARMSGDRKAHNGFQKLRRGELAKLRNYLMLKSLRDEAHIFWLDADVFEIDQGLVQKMIAHAEQRDDVGILTARCSYGENNGNYDLNAWAGTRAPPKELELANQAAAQAERDLPQRTLVSDLIKGTTDDELVSLNTVGGTILYIRASLVSQGVNFPHQLTIGSRWGRDGFDGLETEGLCYRARGLTSSGCFVLGGNWHVRHMIN